MYSVSNKTHREVKVRPARSGDPWTIGDVRQFLAEAELAGFTDKDRVSFPDKYGEHLSAQRVDLLQLPKAEEPQ